jgi:hypothetical protein
VTTAAVAPARTRTRKPPPDPLAGIPCCEDCGALLFEDLLGRLRCIRRRCARYREIVGQAPVDVGVLTAELFHREPDT